VETVDILATPADDAATIVWTPDPSVTALVPGPNVFTATVTAEDETTKKDYTITVYRANAAAEVLDSVNGSKVAAGGTIAVYENGTQLYTAPFNANPRDIWLGAGHEYTVRVTPAGRAQASKEAVAGADDLKVTLISQRLDQPTFPAESPVITAIEYTTADDPADPAATWTAIAHGAEIDFSSITWIRVVARGKSEMDETAWSGFGIKLGIDQVPSVFTGMMPDKDLSTSTYDATGNTFTGTAFFDLAGISLTGGSHFLSVVIYDRANNRTERTLQITNTAGLENGADISNGYFQSLSADLRIYGVTREYFGAGKAVDGLNPLPTGPISYRVAITFKFQTAATGGSAIPILGFKVLRSTDAGSSWTTAGVVNYGGLSTGNAGTHTFYDSDSQLEAGVDYTYKLIVFTDDVHVKESSLIGPARFLAPFTASLSGPANRTIQVDPEDLPEFKFTISEASLWSPEVADRFYFSPVIRRADGAHVYIGYFYYRLTDSRLVFYYPAMAGWYAFSASSTATLISFDSSTGTVTLNPALFSYLTNYATGNDLTLESGATYFWDIFGNYAGSATSNVPAYFQKSGTDYTSRSYADVYQNGQQTLNGWFSFTVK
ncbi:MAG: cadherin-like beta sandwich domain-containing protein, partial [Spirochaetales bacterium]|nr:cadherin-like beta sandwich domain-containing protein [Spirochaetales bacterium]